MIGREFLDSGSFWSFLLSVDADLARRLAAGQHDSHPVRPNGDFPRTVIPRRFHPTKLRRDV